MKNLSISPKTTNWSNFGIYKNVPANTESVRNGAVYFVLPNGKRVLVRRIEDRRILRRAVNSLRKPAVKVETPAVTYKVRLVKAKLKVSGGKTLNRICKVKGSDGTQKVFVTKKAAQAWIKSVSK